MCDTESAFWRAIEVCPEDNLRRLVFADWLAEAGRVEEEAALRATVGVIPAEFKGWAYNLGLNGPHFGVFYSCGGGVSPGPDRIKLPVEDTDYGWIEGQSRGDCLQKLVVKYIDAHQKSAELPLNSRINVVSSSVSPNEYETDSSREAGN